MNIKLNEKIESIKKTLGQDQLSTIMEFATNWLSKLGLPPLWAGIVSSILLAAIIAAGVTMPGCVPQENEQPGFVVLSR